MPEHTSQGKDAPKDKQAATGGRDASPDSGSALSAFTTMTRHAADGMPFNRRDVVFLQRTLGNRATRDIVARQQAMRTRRLTSAAPIGAIQRFEARMHESIEMVGLTTNEQGQAAGLSREEGNAVYFGNWMRDVNQVFVPVVEGMGFGPDVVFPILSYLAKKKFGRSMTPEQFGYYIPAEHIDSPAGLVNPTARTDDGTEDLYPGQPQVNTDTRVPGATPRQGDEVTQQEDVSPSGTVGQANMGIFEVDQNAVMGFIRRSNEHVERRLRLAAQRGRNPEGMMHFGAALHSIEDLFAHSNYVEIAVERFLRDNPPILQRLFPNQAERQRYSDIYNFAPDMQVNPNDPEHPTGQGSETRPVLTTGSFSSTDTQISIASEVGTILSEPLPPARTDAEQTEEDRLVRTLLQQMESQLRNDPQFRQGLRQIVSGGGQGSGSGGQSGDAIDRALQSVPIVTLYDMSNFLVLNLIPEQYRRDIKNFMRTYLSTNVLQPMGQQMQASGLDARVADSTQMVNLQEQQRVAGGNFNAVERETMRATQQGGGASVADQQAERQTGAQRHVDALEQTSGSVIAGPSHSQIAKDHANSPFFGIGFALATQAVRMLREKMVLAWDAQAGGRSQAFDFGWGNFPQDESSLPEDQRQEQRHARNLFHQSRQSRGQETDEAYERGQHVLEHGGLGEEAYSLSDMRQNDADRMRDAAQILDQVANAPGRGAWQLDQLRRLLEHEALPAETERIRERLQQARRALGQVDQGMVVARLHQLAAELNRIAGNIQGAATYDQREAVHGELEALITELVSAAGGVPSGAQSAITQVLVALNRQLGYLSPTYNREQRAFTDAVNPRTGQVRTDPQTNQPAASIPGLPNPRALERGTYTPPDLPTAGPVRDVLETARMIMNHPYDANWWHDVVRQYIQNHPDQIRNDIMARNEGVPFFRRPGESGGHHH